MFITNLTPSFRVRDVRYNRESCFFVISHESDACYLSSLVGKTHSFNQDADALQHFTYGFSSGLLWQTSQDKKYLEITHKITTNFDSYDNNKDIIRGARYHYINRDQFHAFVNAGQVSNNQPYQDLPDNYVFPVILCDPPVATPDWVKYQDWAKKIRYTYPELKDLIPNESYPDKPFGKRFVLISVSPVDRLGSNKANDVAQFMSKLEQRYFTMFEELRTFMNTKYQLDLRVEPILKRLNENYFVHNLYDLACGFTRAQDNNVSGILSPRDLLLDIADDIASL